MNIYLVVEGASVEPKVYPCWIEHFNNNLKKVDLIQDVRSNNYILRSGYGYPYLLNIIENAIKDINQNECFDRLVVALDSEDSTFEEKYKEIEDFINDKNPKVEVKIIIQHFCIETWALGNFKFLSAKPKDEPLKTYKLKFDVCELDPKDLPPCEEEELNRAQFAKKYLKHAIKNRASHMSYSERNPAAIAHPTYFDEIKRRYEEKNHIESFGLFIQAFTA